jgi:hypothetical protein
MTRCALLVLLVATAARAAEPVFRAVQSDGRVEMPAPVVMERLSSDQWPGWLGLWQGMPEGTTTPSGSAWRLVDGQCVMGGFDVGDGVLGWRSGLLGLLSLDLERTRLIGPVSAAMPVDLQRDQVLMVNGDRIDGFLVGIDAERGIGMERGAAATGARDVTWYPIHSATQVQVSGKDQPAEGWRLWLRDGSIVDVQGWRREGGTVELVAPRLPGSATRVTVPWSVVLAIRPPQGALLPMASLPWQASGGEALGRLAAATARVDTDPSPLDLRAVELLGPGTFVAKLPRPDMHVRLRACLPPRVMDMEGCMLVVRDARSRRAEARLDATRPDMEWSGQLEGDRLEIDLQPGPGGAMGSVVSLEDAWAFTIMAPPGARPPSTTAPGEPSGPAGSG